MIQDERDWAEPSEEESAAEERERQEEQLGRLSMHLENELKKAIDHKEPVENRWMRDERQYWGVQHGIGPWEGGDKDEEDLTISENKTRQKTRTIAARISDMMFPTNDRNYTLKATPNPTDIDGNPVDKAEADQAAERVENKIHDYLTECNYPKSGRKAIYDGCRIGTGILKGPFSSGFTRKVARRQWEPVIEMVIDPVTGEEMEQPVMDPETGQPAMQEAGIELQVITETRPAATRVDPWMWFPLPARNVEECEGSFELHLANKEKLRDYARYPNFNKQSIQALLALSPDLGHVQSLMTNRMDILRPTHDRLDKLYAVWEYHGPLEAEQAKFLGLDIPDDELSSIFCEIWFCQGKILKADTTAIDNDHRIPYYVWNYEEDESDLFGYGVPFVMRNEQYVLDKTYSAMVFNAQLTSGPQSIEFKGKVKPADGSNVVKGPKHWIADDPDVTKLEDALQFNNIESAIANIMPIYQLANQNANENTSLPLMLQGEPSQPGQTTSGLAMMMNAANIVQRMSAQSWDDNITLPMLRQFYYWMLMYDEDDDIKMDMEIEPRGASYLLIKDIQAQHSMNLLSMANQDPEFRASLSMPELHRIVINYMDVPTDRLVKTEEERTADQEAMAQQQQMQQAQVEAEIREKNAKATKAEAEAQKAQAEAQAAAAGEDPAKAEREFMLKVREQELREQELMASLYRVDANLQAQIAKIQSQEKIKAADLALKEQLEARRDQVKDQIEQTNLILKQRQMDQQEYLTGMRLGVDMKREQNRQQNLSMGRDSFG